jgi:hypothetical protein
MKAARIKEANAKHCLDRMKGPLFKDGFKIFAKTSETLAKKTAILWEGVYNAIDNMPDTDDQGVNVPDTRDLLKSAVEQIPDVNKQTTTRLPGGFLYKKVSDRIEHKPSRSGDVNNLKGLVHLWYHHRLLCCPPPPLLSLPHLNGQSTI